MGNKSFHYLLEKQSILRNCVLYQLIQHEKKGMILDFNKSQHQGRHFSYQMRNK